MNKRVQNLRKELGKNKIDAIFITTDKNRRYLSGFDGTAGYLFITAKKAVLATDFRYTEQAGIEAPDFEVLRIGGNMADWFPGLITDFKVKAIGFEMADVTVAFHRQLKAALKKKEVKVTLKPVTGLVETLRMVKDAEEIANIRQASAINDLAFEEVEPLVKPGVTEKKIAWEMEKSIRQHGSQSVPFEIIVGSGALAALPHAKPTTKIISSANPVVIDMGAKYNGYATDMTRTLCAGKPDDKFKEIYTIVLEAQAAALGGIKAGMTGGEADNIAREIINKAGYGESFGHALGHGVGLDEHEMPRLGPNAKDVLKDGMVFTVEPGIYITGWGGVRIEDTVVMEGGAARPMTKARKIILS